MTGLPARALLLSLFSALASATRGTAAGWLDPVWALASMASKFALQWEGKDQSSRGKNKELGVNEKPCDVMRFSLVVR